MKTLNSTVKFDYSGVFNLTVKINKKIIFLIVLTLSVIILGGILLFKGQIISYNYRRQFKEQYGLGCKIESIDRETDDSLYSYEIWSRADNGIKFKSQADFWGNIIAESYVNYYYSKDAVEKMFPGTIVKKVNTMNCEGKNKRRGNVFGKTAETKKAIVTLTDDSKDIELFSGI